MEWWRVGLALGLPWLIGAIGLRALWRIALPGVWPLALGYGYFVGLLAITLLLRAQSALGIPLNAVGPAAVLTLLALAGGVLMLWRRRTVAFNQSAAAPMQPAQLGAEGYGPRVLWMLLLLWIGLRLLGLALEVWWRPLYPWDAWTTWMVRPRVWAEWHQLVPFVDSQQWLIDPTGSAYTIEAWHYPATVPLLALWPTLALGAWNETAANLPWLGCALALGLGFYGQARLWGASALTALIFTWMLLSMPLLDSHVALAGYADLWMATVFSLAMIAFLQWTRSGDRRQGIIAVMLSLVCPLIKLEGAVWLWLFLPALIAARLRGRFLLALLGAMVALAVIAGLAGGVVFNVPGFGEVRFTPELIQVPALGRFALGYRGGWSPIVMNFLVLVNWHLLGYLLVATIGVGLMAIFRRDAESWRWRQAEMAFIVSSLFALFVLFFMTDAQRWAEQYTSINRVFLDFAPAFLFCALTVWAVPRPLQPLKSTAHLETESRS